MATQAAIIADTVTGMKKAVKRKAYDSDSDSSVEQLTNRGNKLRKKSRYVHEGQLAPPTGPQIYKRNIEYGGFHRAIISRNPPLVDEDGYEVESDDEDERSRRAIAAAAEFDPYAIIQLEHLLAPLTSAADLPHHPTLAKPFTSNTLTELTRHAGELLQKERASLWRIKHLLTRLSGDNTWVPCESVETDHDVALFSDDWERTREEQLGKLLSKDREDGHLARSITLDEGAGAGRWVVTTPFVETKLVANSATTNPDGANPPPVGTVTHLNVEHGELRLATEISVGNLVVAVDRQLAVMDQSASVENTTTIDPNQTPLSKLDPIIADLEQNPGAFTNVDDVIDDAEDLPIPRRMRTRAQAQAASEDTTTNRDRSISLDRNNESFVHPYFLAPRSSHLHRDLGLPLHEADETRRLLQLYIQKQEEVCRGAQRVYEGLLKANRYRHLVMKWAKAEAHVGVNRDMSDGEDWYDKEEWRLESELKKGQDEEEEDAATTAKKTRTRRQ